MGTLQHKLGKGLFTLAATVALMLGGTTAAQALSVTGTSFYGNEEITKGEIDVLSVDGVSQDTIYLRVTAGEQVIADRLAYNLTHKDQGGSTATDATRGAVVALDFASLDTSGKTVYTITAYADRAETNELYSGNIYFVYAKLSDGSEKLVGTHTTDGDPTDSDSSYNPSSKLYLNGASHRLADTESEPSLEGSKLTYNYSSYSESGTATGTITFVDINGTVIEGATIERPGIASGASETINIPSVVTQYGTNADGSTYVRYFRATRTGSVTLSNPGQLNYTVTCKWMGDNEKGSGLNYYLATIKMVGTLNDGTTEEIASDSVSVTGTYNYTLPNTLYKRHGNKLYKYELKSNQVLTFSAANDGVTTGAKTYTANYEGSEISLVPVTVTYNLIDGSKATGEAGRNIVLDSQTYTEATVDETNTTAEPKESFTADDGTEYVIATKTSDYTYTYGSNKLPVVNVYYLPKGYTVNPDSYDVNVNYVNYKTKQTIKTVKADIHSSSVELAEQAINTEESFSQDGVDYVRLDGQEEPILHSYFAYDLDANGNKTKIYTVYYRDKSDTSTAGVVIDVIRVIYGGTTYTETDGGTTTINGSGQTGDATTAQDAAAADAAAGRLNADGTYNVATGDGGDTTLTNEAGQDANTERINDDETPLASGAEGTGLNLPKWAIGSAIGVGIGLAALLIMFFIKRNRKNNNEA